MATRGLHAGQSEKQNKKKRPTPTYNLPIPEKNVSSTIYAGTHKNPFSLDKRRESMKR